MDSSDLDHVAIECEGAYVLAVKDVDRLQPTRSVVQAREGRYLSIAVEDQDRDSVLLH